MLDSETKVVSIVYRFEKNIYTIIDVHTMALINAEHLQFYLGFCFLLGFVLA